MQLSEAAFEGTIGVGGLFAVTEIQYDRDSDMVTLTWTSSPGQTYTLYYSPDMTAWDTDVEDSIGATPDSETTTFGPFPNPVAGRPDGFFLVVRNP